MKIERFLTLLIALLLVISIGIVGCSDDDDDDNGIDEGFIAAAEDFEGFEGWELIDYTIYPTALAELGPAHGASDPTVARMIYQNTTSEVVDGEYARGSVIVKETFMWDENGEKEPVAAGAFLGMVKRAGEYNAEFDGWEYFMLGADGSIVDRGAADLGECQACHANANTDYIFDHPSEMILEDGGEWEYFEDGTTWELKDSQVGPDPLLGEAHGINDDLIRDVYLWQPGAMYADGQFPIGTTILKEVYQMDGDDKVYVNDGAGAWTAMVKRGGDFNPGHGSWEWFMINPLTEEVMRGGDLMGDMCNTCHAEAGGDEDEGGDYVFHHPDMGF